MDHEQTPAKPWYPTPFGVVICGFLFIADFFLLTEHTAHVFGVLPYLLILACPLMHLFMHQGACRSPRRQAGRGGPAMSHDDMPAYGCGRW